MRSLVFANGSISDPASLPALLRPGDLLIAADGGARHCLAAGLRPDIVIGDFDSLTSAELAALESAGAKLIRFPIRKDFTDLELALQHACQAGANEIIIFGGLGQRWDQTLANLLLAAAEPFAAVTIRLHDGEQEIALLHPGETLHLHGQPGDTVSLIPIAGHVQGITTQGLEYPLRDETLYLGSTRGISNVLLGSQAAITARLGQLICVIIHQPQTNPPKE